MIQKVGLTYNQQHYNNIPPKEDKKAVLAAKIDKLKTYRNRYETQPESYTKVYSAAGAITGAVATLAAFSLKQKCKPHNVKYGLGHMLTMCFAGITGGIAGGSIGTSKKEKTRKIKEGVFQFLNMAMPATCVTGALKLCDKVQTLDNVPARIIGTVAGIATGIASGVRLSNFIVDPKNKEPDRKVTLKDSIANLDDAVGILVLADVKAAKNLRIERAFPFLYSYCGYRAGKSN
ncbi:MAG: hypothetical protein NC200_02510 [Candidatus Gastranaerophilales bacterium]|nr:hypothetical protein [Candidatus Gastranaerophilales bacterium]